MERMKRVRRKTWMWGILCILVAAVLATGIASASCATAEAAGTLLPKKLKMTCSSGAGAWGIYLTVKKNGKFSGEYEDSDMGEYGSGYDETVWHSEFTGTFKGIKKKDGFRYSMKVKDVEFKEKPGTRKIKNRVLYEAKNISLKKGGTYTLYCPGTPVSKIPAEAWSWVTLSGQADAHAEVLAGYILYRKGEDPYYGK